MPPPAPLEVNLGFGSFYLNGSGSYALFLCATLLVALGDVHDPAKNLSPMFLEKQKTTAPNHSLRWTPQVAGAVGYAHSYSSMTFGVGPRISGSPSGSRLTFFGQALVGGLHYSFAGAGGTDFLLTPGGGVLVAIPDHRLQVSGELDFPMDFFDGAHQTGRQFVFGVTLPLGASK